MADIDSLDYKDWLTLFALHIRNKKRKPKKLIKRFWVQKILAERKEKSAFEGIVKKTRTNG